MAASYSLTLVVLAVVPSPAPYVAPGVSDSLLHAVAYGVLAFLASWTVQLPVAPAAAAGLAWSVALGIATELLQGLVPWRSLELRDVAWDLAGAAVGVLVWAGVCSVLQLRRREPR